MIIHLYYKDKNRAKRGYAQNYNLLVNYKDKTFRTFENSYYWYEGREDIEVSKKSDLINYKALLEKQGFKEEKSDF